MKISPISPTTSSYPMIAVKTSSVVYMEHNLTSYIVFRRKMVQFTKTLAICWIKQVVIRDSDKNHMNANMVYKLNTISECRPCSGSRTLWFANNQYIYVQKIFEVLLFHLPLQ